MRALLCLAIAGCGFSSQSNPSHRDAATGDPDAPMQQIDASLDAPQVNCPATYDLKSGGHSYRKTAATADYPTIQAECHDGVGYVVDIDSSEEDTWVKNQFGSNGYIWIGLHFDVPMGYRWDNHEKLAADYNNFSGSTVPSAPTDACVDKSLSPSTGGIWAPYVCTQAHQSLCECDGP